MTKKKKQACADEKPSVDSDPHKLASLGDTVALKRLIEQGSEVNAIDEYKNTPFILAAKGGYIETIEMLLSQGADINTKGCGGLTALHQAALQQKDRVLEVLISR